MSITSTLSSALSGLTAASRAAELISSNVANAMTEGYARRELGLSARRVGDSGQGVAVTGVQRNVDRVLLSDRRIASAGAAGIDLQSGFLARMETLLGNSDQAGSFLSRIAALDTALIEAAAHPESTARLTAVAEAARSLVRGFNDAGRAIQTERARADSAIAAEVTRLNSALAGVAELNRDIRSQHGTGRDVSALMDQRQRLIDDIATIVPLREVQRDHGEVALFTTGGSILLEGRPVTFGFTSVSTVTADMTLASGALSGLTVNGQAVNAGNGVGGMGGGTLAAQFAIRDGLAPQTQSRLDSLARDLIDRFADPALDPTLAPGDPGLFTDLGAAFDPLNEAGLSQRLHLNALADPQQGGALWRLRDGLGAAAPGPPGNGLLLAALQGRLGETRIPGSVAITDAPRSLSALAGDMTSLATLSRVAAETEGAFSQAKFGALREMEMQQGIDTDQELQSLLLVEQAYAANARIIQSVDEMIQTLLGL
jgi:flagellar hook-associated protein 1 FlgK